MACRGHAPGLRRSGGRFPPHPPKKKPLLSTRKKRFLRVKELEKSRFYAILIREIENDKPGSAEVEYDLLFDRQDRLSRHGGSESC